MSNYNKNICERIILNDMPEYKKVYDLGIVQCYDHPFLTGWIICDMSYNNYGNNYMTTRTITKVRYNRELEILRTEKINKIND